MNWWEIPVPIIEAALFHHDPLNDAVMNKELVCVVHIANYYSWKMLDDQSSSQALKVDVLDYLRIEEDNLNRVIDEFTKELGKSSLT